MLPFTLYYSRFSESERVNLNFFPSGQPWLKSWGNTSIIGDEEGKKMSLMQNTSNIKKTSQSVYLITLVRRSADRPMYLDHMVYDSAAAGQKFMTNLAAAFERAGYRLNKNDADHYQLDNGLDKITLTGSTQSVFED